MMLSLSFFTKLFVPYNEVAHQPAETNSELCSNNLLVLKINDEAKVTNIECTDQVALSKLTGLGIKPDAILRLRKKTSNFCTIQVGNRMIGVSRTLAQNILIN